MHKKSAAALSLVLLLCFSGLAQAVPVVFTGDVDVDFAGHPLAQSRPDVVGDSKGWGGIADEPLGEGAFEYPTETPVPPSGFNIERTVMYYDDSADVLYLGVDIADGKIAWDADGNGDIITTNPFPLGPDQPALHPMFGDDGLECYRIELDINPEPVYNPDVCHRRC